MSNSVTLSMSQLIDYFDKLPGWNDEFITPKGSFQISRLWTEHLINCSDPKNTLDPIDELNAQLACAAISKRSRLLIGLPDARPIRRSAILATVGVRTYMRACDRKMDGGNVLYFGTKIGIRNQISKVKVGGTNLNSIFDVSCSKGAFSQKLVSGPVPRFICVYSPIDPVSILESVRPVCIAIDCDDSIDLPWLNDLLHHMEKAPMTVIAWSSNPLSVAREHFIKHKAKIFTWPLKNLCAHEKPKTSGEGSLKSNCILNSVCSELRIAELISCQLTGPNVDAYTTFLRSAERELARGMAIRTGRLSVDALLVGYRLLRTLERLCVPLGDYEAEVDHHWGAKSIAAIEANLKRFLSVAKGLPVADPLERAYAQMRMAIDWLRENPPPIWNALIDFCLEDTSEGIARLLTFNTEALATMFVNAMSLREGANRESINMLSVFPTSFGSLRRFVLDRENFESSSDLDELGMELSRYDWTRLRVTLVGIPSEHLVRSIAPILSLNTIEFLHYQYQSGKVDKIAEFLDASLFQSHGSWITTLNSLETTCENYAHVDVPNGRVRISTVRSLQGRPNPTKKISTSVEPLWTAGDPERAIQYLFANEEEDQEHFVGIENSENSIEDDLGDEYSTPLTVDKAMQVDFLGGWFGVFGTQQRLNFIADDGSISRRSIANAKPNDRVLYIIGHHQQSLYDLVVSRVHDDPEIQIHLTYIRRWQQEARDRYRVWARSGKSIDDLHTEMQSLGSKLISNLAIRWWCSGLTLRPHDVEDLSRIARVLGMPFTGQCYLQIHRAGDRIHALHIQLSLKLRNWIRNGATTTEMRDDLLDEKTGLTFGDIQDALLVLRIHKCSKVDGPFCFSSLGRIERIQLNA